MAKKGVLLQDGEGNYLYPKTRLEMVVDVVDDIEVSLEQLLDKKVIAQNSNGQVQLAVKEDGELKVINPVTKDTSVSIGSTTTTLAQKLASVDNKLAELEEGQGVLPDNVVTAQNPDGTQVQLQVDGKSINPVTKAACVNVGSDSKIETLEQRLATIAANISAAGATASEAKAALDNFLTGEGLENTLDSLKDIQAALEGDGGTVDTIMGNISELMTIVGKLQLAVGSISFETGEWSPTVICYDKAYTEETKNKFIKTISGVTYTETDQSFS
jgi:outer membrane murein-binding lipoprotein Lpp